MDETLFLSDVDGTLCEADWDTGEEHFAKENLRAIEAYRARGGRFGVCTGRSREGVTDSLRGVVDVDYYVVTTGAQVLDRELRDIQAVEIDRALVHALFRRYASERMLFVVVTEREAVSVARPVPVGLRHVATLDELEEPLYGVSLECHGDEAFARETARDLNARFAGRLSGFQNLGSVDVVASGCSKGEGLEVVRAASGARLIAGIGDSYNDLTLLGAADVSYTFHGSPEEVRAAATKVVGSLAEALAHFQDLVRSR